MTSARAVLLDALIGDRRVVLGGARRRSRMAKGPGVSGMAAAGTGREGRAGAGCCAQREPIKIGATFASQARIASGSRRSRRRDDTEQVNAAGGVLGRAG